MKSEILSCHRGISSSVPDELFVRPHDMFAGRARGSALQQERAFADIAGKGGRTLEFGACLMHAIQPGEQIAAHAGQYTLGNKW